MSTARHACVIGWPISHSRSPIIHGYWLARYGIAGSYRKEPVRTEELPSFLASLEKRGLIGCNVTVPHKQTALGLCRSATAEARSVGAANTLWLEDGRLHATNTDVYGFMTHLDRSAPGWQRTDRPALLIGAGGAARAVAFGLLQRGVERVLIANRTRANAEALAGQLGPKLRVLDWDRRARWTLAEAGLVVNTSTLGMTGAPPLDLDLAGASDDAVVADIVYTPLQTPLLAAALARGMRTVDGLGMLLHQAVKGFEIWFGTRPEVTEELRALVAADIEAR